MSAHPTQLFALLFSAEKFDQLETALNQTRERMKEAGEEEMWLYWRALLFAGRGSFAEAEQIAAGLEPDEQFGVRKIIEVQRSKQTADWKPLADLLLRRWNETHETSELLALCQAKLNAGDHQFVAEHAHQMVAAIKSQEAMEIAVTGLMRSRAWRACLALLDSNAALFPESRLPVGLRRARIVCEQNLGMLTAALGDAEALATESQEAADLERLFDLRVHAGNMKGALGPALTLLKNPGTRPETLVRMGWILRFEDQAFSSEALRLAVGKGLSGPPIGPATLLAHELALADVSAVLMPKMVEEAGKPNAFVKPFAISEIIASNQDAERRAHELFQMLRAGRVPVHVIGSALRPVQALWPILALSGVRHGLQHQTPPIFFRHGGRPADVPDRKIEALCLDYTALITASELGLLAIVEKAYARVLVPPSLRAVLVHLMDQLGRGQPDFDAGRSDVLKLVDQQKIRAISFPRDPEDVQERDGMGADWWAMVAEAGRRNAWVVDYWPKLKRDFTAYVPEPAIAKLLTQAVAVLMAMRTCGAITEHELQAAQPVLSKTAPGMPFDQLPARGATLFTSVTMAEAFARAGVLERVAATFDVSIPAAEIEFLRREVKNTAGREYVVAQLGGLLQRVQVGGLYQELASRPVETGEALSDEVDVVMREVGELTRALPEPGLWHWIDDRWTNGHERVGTTPIISTFGVLADLHQRGHLDDTSFYAARHRLRGADYRFVPTSGKELLYFLNQAQIAGDDLIEQPELVTLRQYYARLVPDRDTLQLPPLGFTSARPRGELEFLMSLSQAVVEAITDCFKADVVEAIQQARADWLLDNLWYPPEQFVSILGRTVAEAQVAATHGLGDALFFSRLLDQKGFAKEGLERCTDWLEARLLASTERQIVVAGQLRRTLTGQAQRRFLKANEERVHTLLMQRWYFSLPESIRDWIELPPRTEKRLGIAPRSVITVGDAHFVAEDFWATAGKAYSGKPAELKAVDGQGPFKFRKESAQAIIVEGTEAKQNWRIADPLIECLDPLKRNRVPVLLRHPEWCDAPRAELPEELAGIPNVAKRLLTIEETRRHSCFYRYRVLEAALSKNSGPTILEMTPADPAELKHYLRWESLSDGSPDWEKMTARSIREVGCVETFRRFATLPRALSSSLVEAFRLQARAKQEAMVAQLEMDCRSPLSRAQLLHLKAKLGLKPEVIAPAASILLGEEALADTQALLQVMRWTWGRLGAFNPKPGLAGVARLVFTWVHAGQLFEVLRKHSPAEHILKYFTQNEQPTGSEILIGVPEEADVCYPRNFTADVLLVTAVGSALRDVVLEGQSLAQIVNGVAKEKAAKQEGETTWPTPEWLFDPSVFSDALESFLGEPRERVLAPVLGDEFSKRLSTAQLRPQIEALVAALEQDPAKGEIWTMLGVVLRGRPCPESLRPRLATLSARVEFSSIVVEDAARFAVLLTMSAQAWSLGGEDLLRKFQKEIAGYARWIAHKPDATDNVKRHSETVIRCVLALTRHVPNGRAVAYYTETLLLAWAEWPALGVTLHNMVPFFLQLPDAQLRLLWELILAIRRHGGDWNVRQ